MDKVSVTIQGGLGNQLFQFAAGYALAKKLALPLALNLEFFAIKVSEHVTPRPFLLDKYNVSYESFVPVLPKPLSRTFFARLKRYIMRKLKVSFPKNDLITAYSEKFYYFNDEFLDIKSGCTISGWFQSELYFKEYADDIRRIFTYKKSLSELGQANLLQIQNQKVPVSLHVRRGDFVKLQSAIDKHGTVSLDYYKRAVDLIQKIYGNKAHFFIFSDDPAYAEKEFSFLPNSTILIGDTKFPHEDMFLMSQCHHHILANSSFSWWGAWLNPRTDKTVIAPRWWYSRPEMKITNTMDLYPEGWVII